MDNNENLFYCTNGPFGISKFDNNDSMMGICHSLDKSLWIKFTYEEAKEIERIIDYCPVLAD